MKGRKPKLQVIEGGGAPDGCPRPPAWLSNDSKAEWDRVAPLLHGQGRLTPAVMAMLEAYCIAVGAVREAERTMAAEGRIIVRGGGDDRQPALQLDGADRRPAYLRSGKGKSQAAVHPAFKIQMAAMREARLLAAELRITRDASGDAPTPPPESEADGWDADLLA